MIAALLVAGWLQAAAVPAGEAASATPAPAADAGSAATLFLFFRARYFHDAAAARHCGRAWPGRVQAVDARFAAARRRLREIHGRRFDRVRSPEIERGGPDGDCRLGATLSDYENAVAELERVMAAAQ